MLGTSSYYYEEVTENRMFISGVLAFVELKTSGAIIGIFTSDGKELDIQCHEYPDFFFDSTTVKFDFHPETDKKEHNEKINAEFQRIAKEHSGYVIFAYCMSSFVYMDLNESDGRDFLRGAKWVYDFLDWNHGNDYEIDSLYLNGEEIDDIPGHIASLTNKVSK